MSRTNEAKLSHAEPQGSQRRIFKLCALCGSAWFILPETHQ